MNKVTIKDVAQRAGVSTTTVSRVLNNRRSGLEISDETRERVLEAARDLAYTPNIFARGLKASTSHTLGVLVAGSLVADVSAFIDAFNREAYTRGYRVLAAVSDGGDSAQNANGFVQSSSAPVDGLLLLGSTALESIDQFGFFTQGPPYLVSVLAGMPAGRVASFNVDNGSGLRLLVEHLSGLNHRDIAFVGGEGSWNAAERLSAYRALIEEGCLGSWPGYIQLAPDTPAAGAGAVNKLVNLSPPPTAIICSSDGLAMGVLARLHELGLRVPQQISLAGFGDQDFSRWLVPALSTVRLPLKEIATRSASLLVSMIAGDFDPWLLTNTLVRPELAARASTNVSPR